MKKSQCRAPKTIEFCRFIRLSFLPPGMRALTSFSRNAAGKGAQRAALNVEEYEICSRLAEETEFLELARDQAFPDAFMEELLFPV